MADYEPTHYESDSGDSDESYEGIPNVTRATFMLRVTRVNQKISKKKEMKPLARVTYIVDNV